MANTLNQVTIVSSSKPFFELRNSQGKVLQFYLQQDCHCIGRDRTWADLEIPEFGWDVISRRQAVLQREGEEYRLYDGDGENTSRNGIFINHSRLHPSQGYLLKNGTQLQIGQDPENCVLLTYFNPASNQIIVTASKPRLNLKGLKEWPVELGREPDSQRYAAMQLDSPIVSRHHATISLNPQGGYILHDHSTNGTFVNGQRVERFVQLKEGDRIKIGPFTLLYQKHVLELSDRGNQIRLDAFNLVRKVADKEAGQRLILDDVTLAISPGQLVALVGGSGAGKSTLMKTFLGIEPTTSGTVFLNGDDLRKNFDLYRSQIGYVPQDDIVHRDLTVEEVLIYACKLRLPPDTDVNQIVQKTLEQIKLNHVKNTFVRDLSGGQRKRVSIGVELLADPKLFFLDEPTSGLDPGLDKEMMKLLRELADQGRTVILVTHATANIEECDRIAFMGRGGKLCYFGTPEAALKFFEMPAADLKYFSDIYIKLDQGKTKKDVQANVSSWATKFINSSDYQFYIQSCLQPGKCNLSAKKSSHHRGISPLQQMLLLSQRSLQLIWRDRISLFLALFTGPIGIALINIAVPGKNPLVKLANQELTQASLALRVLFVFSCVAIWVGISCSAQEIVRESAIYARERLVNLSLFSYLGSKLLVRSALALLQTLLLVAAILICFKWPESHLIYWPMGLGITSFLTLLSSISLGLMLSAFVRNENQANNALPLIMIPQFIFSGVLFELKDLPSKISWFMLSRWSVGAYGSMVDVNAMIPKLPNIPGQSLPPQPIKANIIYAPTWHNLSLYWGILCFTTLVYLVITLYLQKRKDMI